jgi:hypothetical protein
MVNSIVERYERAEIDSVYIVYNEFKSVISQRLVVEKLLPIRKLGAQEITAAEEMTEEQREAAARAAQSSGVSVFAADDAATESEAKKFGTAEVDYIYDHADISCAAGIGGGGTCGAHDGDRRGEQERRGPDRQLELDHEPPASGGDYQGNY